MGCKWKVSSTAAKLLDEFSIQLPIAFSSPSLPFTISDSDFNIQVFDL